ncbi:MAG TPA: ABC transporter ATP-binding protein/permease [Rhodocyclaceae bacterium]|jgi:ATP-binding cassette subfamily B protein|nr:ABC transporter ATP-binding protein/permease [Betaproteobacteria bacterium]HMV01231.1 ABC transporter ATP-binding protein/permease [Rhodocyclaceae bacterium]HMV19944.1 ABC transporter ATP-binding protein/permease [Rhodocyclaceae bacterium]HNM21571.1 ABC transporter ATP-binding protein/permease [Rhodocyclaceae bacterium]HNM81255.1 ABC transporter ATP-binding protein/permease [Rhodocyclaceae bacterium]
MRRTTALPRPPVGTPLKQLHVWPTLKTLLPYLWRYRLRVVLALSCLVGAKVANVSVPLIFKEVIDDLSGPQQVLALPAVLLLLYGALRFSTSLFTELREILFARVTQQAVRQVALEVFRHLHALALRFHLERQTGGVSRDIERGTRSIGSLISYSLYSILPTLVEISLVLGILFVRYDLGYVLITAISISAYVVFTVKVSNWRIDIRRAVNESDSAANTRAVDSLINYETVKYFNNEDFEARRYDAQMLKWEDAATRSQTTLSVLNLGQQAIIATGVTAMMWRAAAGVVAGTMTLGDLVLVNAFLIQLYTPLNFLGMVYREIRQALTDIERMFGLLNEHREIADAPDARELPPGPLRVEFASVGFAYEPERTILDGVDFSIEVGQTVAVVGPSGAGKSTLARLLFRFYDVTAGAVRINGHDLRSLKQASLRSAIGIVPQDTVLFNDSIFYNIQYGRPEASREEVIAAARSAQLHDFIESLPQKYETRVGERGLKLSGGEKQRVAIARTLLKNPPLLVFDEATSALDSHTEKAIQGQLELAAQGRTVLVIAHRLSTVMNADAILVMDGGRIVERGNHSDLLAADGAYARLWSLQQREETSGSA